MRALVGIRPLAKCAGVGWDMVPISKADIMERVPGISVKTVELVLSKMLKEDKIKKIGTYRDARYMKK